MEEAIIVTIHLMDPYFAFFYITIGATVAHPVEIIVPLTDYLAVVYTGYCRCRAHYITATVWQKFK